MSRSPSLIDVVLAELDGAALEALADLLAPLLAAKQPALPQADGWIDTKAAGDYLGISRNAIHRMTAERSIPFEQDCAGAKCWFKRSQLDAWRRGEWRR